MAQDGDAAHDPEFVPENVEFRGYIGGWDLYVGIDSLQSSFYLIRTKDRDWLEEVHDYCDRTLIRDCRINFTRQGSKREAATQLLDAYVRSGVHYHWPIPPYRSGLLTDGELERIVEAVSAELKRNSEIASETQRRQEASIIKTARELGLNPRPAGHNDSAWMADCPRTPSHWMMISSKHNEFGCGYCRRSGGPQELRAFYDDVPRRHTRS